MTLLARRSFFAVIATLLFVSAAAAQVTSVSTSGAGAATYGTTSQSAGPFPWTDLGFTASASINPGGLVITTGGSTSFDLASGAVTPSEIFTPGSTAVNVGYTPGWSGSSILSLGSTGGFQSNFVYNIGPFNGSTNILNVPLITPGSLTNLNSSLNTAVVNPPVINSQTVGGPGVSLSATLSAQAGPCPLCVTVASVSLNFSVGTQISQTVLATPQTTYGDLVWYSTSQTFPGVSHTTFVPGNSINSVSNIFAPPSPSSLGLTSGQTLYFNMLPVVMLNMPVTNDASVAVPASIGASWDIFGASGSTTFASGDLYTLDAGPDSVDFDGTWYDDQYYSIPLEYTAANPNCPPVIACFPTYETFPGGTGGGGSVMLPGGIPPNIPGLTVNMPGGSTSGPGTMPNGPLFPNDPGPNGGCPAGVAAGSPQCATQITQTITPTPEPSGLLFLGSGLLGIAGVLRRRLRA